MIESFNRRQVVKAVVAVICSIVALVCTVAFFYWGPLIVMYNMGIENRSQYAWGCVVVGKLAAPRSANEYGRRRQNFCEF